MHSNLSAEHTPSKGHIQELGVNVSPPILGNLEAISSLTSGCTPVVFSLRPVFQVLQGHDINDVSGPYPKPSSRSATSLLTHSAQSWPSSPGCQASLLIDSLPNRWRLKDK